jgi:hypothetical protein
VIEGWRKLYNEDLQTCTLHPVSLEWSSRTRWAGYVTRMGEKRNAYRIFVGKTEWKRPLGRHS